MSVFVVFGLRTDQFACRTTRLLQLVQAKEEEAARMEKTFKQDITNRDAKLHAAEQRYFETLRAKDGLRDEVRAQTMWGSGRSGQRGRSSPFFSRA